MRSEQLRAFLQSAENRTRREIEILRTAGQEYQSAMARAAQAESMADELSCISADDDEARRAIYQRISACYAMAAAARQEAAAAQNRRQAARRELSALQSEYASCRARGEEAVNALRQAAGKLKLKPAIILTLNLKPAALI